MKYVFKEILNVDIPTPFIRMPYSEAMSRFGSDKPDTRFGLELVDLSGILAKCEFKVFGGALAAGGSVRAIKVPPALRNSLPRMRLTPSIPPLICSKTMCCL